MRYEVKSNCPLHNFEPCKQMDCAWFTHLRGIDPNKGKEVDEWGCAVAWLPMLLVENSQQQRHTGAAVESFRNEMVRSNETSQQVLLATAMNNTPKFIEGNR
jgi:hypothetical protein